MAAGGAVKRLAQFTVNWTELAERVPAEQKQLFNAFKARSDGYLRKVMAHPEVPPKIDWSMYKSKVAMPGLVDQFQKQYEALKIPYPKESVTPQVDSQEKAEAVSVKGFIKESEANIAQYKKELEHWEKMVPFEIMTKEEFTQYFPTLALDPVNNPTFWPHDRTEAERLALPDVDHAAKWP